MAVAEAWEAAIAKASSCEKSTGDWNSTFIATLSGLLDMDLIALQKARADAVRRNGGAA